MSNLQLIGFDKYADQKLILERSILRAEEDVKRASSTLSLGISRSITTLDPQVSGVLALYFGVSAISRGPTELSQITLIRNGFARIKDGFDSNIPFVRFDRSDHNQMEWYRKTFKRELGPDVAGFIRTEASSANNYVPIIDIVYPNFEKASQLNRDRIILHEMAHAFVPAPKEIYYLDKNGINRAFENISFKDAVINADSYAIGAIDIYFGKAAYFERNY